MTCYFRHLKDIFKLAGIEVSSDNRKEVDRFIHDMVGVKYKDCPKTWREVKKRTSENEEQFISTLKQLSSQSQHRRFRQSR